MARAPPRHPKQFSETFENGIPRTATRRLEQCRPKRRCPRQRRLAFTRCSRKRQSQSASSAPCLASTGPAAREKRYLCTVIEFIAVHDFGGGIKGAGFQVKEMGEDGKQKDFKMGPCIGLQLDMWTEFNARTTGVCLQLRNISLSPSTLYRLVSHWDYLMYGPALHTVITCATAPHSCNAQGCIRSATAYRANRDRSRPPARSCTYRAMNLTEPYRL